MGRPANFILAHPDLQGCRRPLRPDAAPRVLAYRLLIHDYPSIAHRLTWLFFPT